MAQVFLAPADNVRPNTSWSPTRPVPNTLREFGKYPNIEEWKPADLLLVSSVVPDIVTKQIIETQRRGGFHPDDARWQHAAVYLGDGYVMEATTHGVRYSPIYPYLGKHLLRVRRPIGLEDEAARWRIAIQAAVRANEKYRFASIFRIYVRSFNGLWRSPITGFQAQTRALICSQLYSDSYSAVTGLLLTQTVSEIITPAALSASDQFEDVPLFWKTIPS
jgi:hypothetical protein